MTHNNNNNNNNDHNHNHDSLIHDLPFWYMKEEAYHAQYIIQYFERRLQLGYRKGSRAPRQFIGCVRHVGVVERDPFITVEELQIFRRCCQPLGHVPSRTAIRLYLVEWNLDGIPISARTRPVSQVPSSTMYLTSAGYLYCLPGYGPHNTTYTYFSSPEEVVMGHRSLRARCIERFERERSRSDHPTHPTASPDALHAYEQSEHINDTESNGLFEADIRTHSEEELDEEDNNPIRSPISIISDLDSFHEDEDEDESMYSSDGLELRVSLSSSSSSSSRPTELDCFAELDPKYTELLSPTSPLLDGDDLTSQFPNTSSCHIDNWSDSWNDEEISAT